MFLVGASFNRAVYYSRGVFPGVISSARGSPHVPPAPTSAGGGAVVPPHFPPPSPGETTRPAFCERTRAGLCCRAMFLGRQFCRSLIISPYSPCPAAPDETIENRAKTLHEQEAFSHNGARAAPALSRFFYLAPCIEINRPRALLCCAEEAFSPSCLQATCAAWRQKSEPFLGFSLS